MLSVAGSAGSAVALALALALCGCGPARAGDPLAGTTWQLLDIESMTSEQPGTTIVDPSRYTVTFGDDGQAAFQVDCNRGTASWRATPSPEPESGSLSFGPVGLTRMACPQPAVDARVAEALGYVRSYLLSDGKLHLSLEADSGIMHWQPRRPG